MYCFESCTRLKANTVTRRGNSGGRRGWHEYEFSRSQKWTILTEIDQSIIRTFYDWEAWISAITDTETRCQTDPVRFANNFYYESMAHISNQIPMSNLSPFAWLPQVRGLIQYLVCNMLKNILLKDLELVEWIEFAF